MHQSFEDRLKTALGLMESNGGHQMRLSTIRETRSRSRYEEFARYVRAARRIAEAAPGGWKADLHSEPVIVSQEQKDGTIKKIKVTKYWIVCSNGRERLNFKVSKGKDGYPVFTDDRETRTGSAKVVNTGPLPGEQYAKAGSDRKLTATGWANEVERLIGPAEVGKIFVQLVQKGFKAG